MLGRHTTDGRFEHEIESNFLSRNDARANYQRRKVLKKEPKLEDLEDQEQGIREIDDGVEVYLRVGKVLYKQTYEKVI